MTDAQDALDEIEIAKARAHMTTVAKGLALKYGPRLAASLLLGAAGGVIEAELKLDTSTWLREMADEYERNEDGGPFKPSAPFVC